MSLKLKWRNMPSWWLGLRSHILRLNRIPTATDIHSFIKNQLEFTEYANSFIINYFDTTHTFIFTISDKGTNPNNFSEINLSKIRDPATVQRMNLLMQSEGLVAFAPLNLYEGFVGLPIDFRLVHNNKIVGYITPLIDIKNILKTTF